MSEPGDPLATDTGGTQGAAGDSAAPQADVRTFLIADIRGYTTYTREHGDEAAAALINRFAAIVTEVAAARDGFLLEMRGDEALVAFVSARKALRAAVDLQARFATEGLPRGVGIGLDAGEAIPVGDGYRGTSLNLAARLCAQAAAGETLASEAVMHLAAKIDGIAYVDARDLKLKGYTQAVRAVVVLPAERAKGHRLATDRRTQSRSAAIGLGAIAALAVIVASVGTYLFNGRPGATASPPPTSLAIATPSARPTVVPPSPTGSPDPLGGAVLPVLAFYNADSHNLVATTPFKSPRNISFFAGGSFWMMSQTDQKAFHEIDPQTHSEIKSITVPVDEALGFIWDDDYIWVTDLAGPVLWRIDERTATTRPIPFGRDDTDTAPGFDVAVGDGAVWVARPDVQDADGNPAPEIDKVDRDTGKVLDRIHVDAEGMSYGADSVWYWRGHSVGRIDPTTDQVFDPVELPTDDGLGNIYFAGDSAWTAKASTGVIYRIPKSGQFTSYTLAPGVGEMTATDKTMWVTNANTGVLTGIDIATGAISGTIDPGHAVLSVTSNGDELMVAVDETVDEVIARLPGSVLTVASNGFNWTYPPPDPPLNGNWDVQQALYLTCAKLFNYPDLAGPKGLILQPEVASSVAVSADGKTYTFTVGSGFQFSPPSNEAVTAETFVHTLLRAVNPLLDDDQPGPRLFGDIVGVKEFREGQSTFVGGLSAIGDQLQITLNRPVPDFLDRLATSFACVVPIHGTPVLRSGLNPNPPVSGAGPYYVSEKVRKQLVVLKRNPNYHGTRPQPFDEIAILQQVSPTEAIAEVGTGQLDSVSFDCCDPISGPGSALAAEWGADGPHAASGDQHWFGGPKTWLDFLALNPNRAPFDDPDVRRAVALALNRTNLAHIWSELPSSQLLVPPLVGTDPTRAVDPPNVDEAKALMKGRTFDVTMVGCAEDWDNCATWNDFEAEVTRDLKAIGINVTVWHPPGGDYPGDGVFDGHGNADIVSWTLGTEYPEAASLLGEMAGVPWIGQENVDELNRLQGLAGEPRSTDSAAFARRIVDTDYLALPIGYHVFPFFTSERIGCGFVQDAIGAVDLLSLCAKWDSNASGSPSPAP